MLGAFPLAHRPLAAAPSLPRPWVAAAVSGEYGWASWSFSRQAKLNAWAWHGVGTTNVLAWATLGDCMYFRREDDSFVHLMQAEPDAGEVPTDSQSVFAESQWLDYGKPGKMKALTGIDADCQGVETLEIYISVDGDREGTLAETIPIGANNGGWTYSGEVIPVNVSATEFKVRFVGDPSAVVSVNRVTFHYDEIAG